jgi:biopolymer transport protein ExbB/TolQ
VIRPLTWSAAALSFLIGANAAAQTAPPAVAPADPPFALVAAEDRLTLGGVFADADIVMQLVMAGLLIATVLSAVVWISHAVRRQPGRGLAGGLTLLSAVSAAGPLIGLFGSAYCMLMSFIGASNVRPAPSLSILAPGFAEATMSAMLGLLAAAIATVGHRHLKGKVFGFDTADDIAREPVQTAPRQARATA